MSTRATYRFKSDPKYFAGVDVTLYIHHDGYPGGAASYFYNALVHENRRGSGVESMLRANEVAEITEGHDFHGDTEFRYDVTGSGPTAQLVAYKRSGSWSRNADPEWLSFFTGTLAEFIDQQARDDKSNFWIADYSAFRPTKTPYGATSWLNRITASRRIGPTADKYDLSIVGHLRIWATNGACRPGSANWDGLAEELRALVTAFPELMTDEIGNLIAPPALV